MNLYALQTTARDSRGYAPKAFKRIWFETRERAEWYMNRRDLDPNEWEIIHADEGGTLAAYAEAAHNERYAGR